MDAEEIVAILLNLFIVYGWIVFGVQQQTVIYLNFGHKLLYLLHALMSSIFIISIISTRMAHSCNFV